MNKSLLLLKRMYGNYNFYFLNGMEVEQIVIYENKEILFAMDKPWFGKVEEVNFEEWCYLRENNDLTLNGEAFYIKSSKKNRVKLYLPNSITKFEKIATENRIGVYNQVDIYQSKNLLLDGYKEEINVGLNEALLQKVNKTSSNSVNVHHKKDVAIEAVL